MVQILFKPSKFYCICYFQVRFCLKNVILNDILKTKFDLEMKTIRELQRPQVIVRRNALIALKICEIYPLFSIMFLLCKHDFYFKLSVKQPNG